MWYVLHPQVALYIFILIRTTTEQVYQVLLIHLIIIFTLRACKVILSSFCGASDQNVLCLSANLATERPQNQKCLRGSDIILDEKCVAFEHGTDYNAMYGIMLPYQSNDPEYWYFGKLNIDKTGMEFLTGKGGSWDQGQFFSVLQ